MTVNIAEQKRRIAAGIQANRVWWFVQGQAALLKRQRDSYQYRTFVEFGFLFLERRLPVLGSFGPWEAFAYWRLDCFLPGESALPLDLEG